MTFTDPAKQRAWSWFEQFYGTQLEQCGDNFRLAEMGNSVEEAEYSTKKENGCCGSVDVSYFDRITHRAFLVGCNYGH